MIMRYLYCVRARPPADREWNDEEGHCQIHRSWWLQPLTFNLPHSDIYL
jgi:hypothetical protein